MKLALSTKAESRKHGKHLVLTVSSNEIEGLDSIIRQYVTQGRTPAREAEWEHYRYAPGGPVHKRIKQVVYRFHRGYLERLLLTFPQAQVTPAAQKYLWKDAKAKFDDREIPKFKIPGSKVVPWDFQWFGIEHCIDVIQANGVFSEVYGGYLNDEVGLGKTYQVLCALAITDPKDVLIITTNSGKWAAWKRLAEELFRRRTFDMGVVGSSKAEKIEVIEEAHQITVVNPEALRATRFSGAPEGFEPAIPELFDKEWQVIIVDESHKFKNPDNQQTRGFLNLQGVRWICMSGTPFLNRPDEIWPVLHVVDPERWPSYHEFLKDLVIETKGKTKAYNPEKVAEIKEFLDRYGLRRRKDQVSDDLPQTIYSTINVELTAAQRKLYNKIKQEFLLELADGRQKKILAVIAQVTRLKQACFSPELYEGKPESAKIVALKELVEKLVANGEKAIIYSQWSTATRIIERELAEYNPAYVDGSVKGEDRLAQINKFNNDEDCHLYVGTIGANQEAITLSAATYVIFCDKAWSPLANDQAIGRSAAGGLRGAHLGGEAKINVISLYAENTIEEAIDNLLAEKSAMFTNIIESDGGPIVERGIISSITDLLQKDDKDG